VDEESRQRPKRQGKPVPDAVWRKIDCGGPSALSRLTGIRQQDCSRLMHYRKTPNVEEVMRMLCAFPVLALDEFVVDGAVICESIRTGHPVPMQAQAEEDAGQASASGPSPPRPTSDMGAAVGESSRKQTGRRRPVRKGVA
jgi:hypothetical protein